MVAALHCIAVCSGVLMYVRYNYFNDDFTSFVDDFNYDDEFTSPDDGIVTSGSEFAFLLTSWPCGDNG